ncbi:MAG: YybH family protein [Gemmatimonadota bacterium]
MRDPMRTRPWILAILAILGSSAPSSAQGTPEDEVAIRQLIESHAVAWDHHDAAAAAAPYREDASVRLSDARELQGRREIEEWHRELFRSKALRASRHSHPGVMIRFLRPDVAVADVESRITGMRGPDGVELDPVEARLIMILTRKGSVWRIAVQRTIAGG